MATAVPTFGEMLAKIKKVNPHIGMIEDGFYYDISELIEEQKFHRSSNIIQFSVVNYMTDLNCTKDNLLKVYHGFMRFNHYIFVKKLQNQKIWSSAEMFKMMTECLYN